MQHYEVNYKQCNKEEELIFQAKERFVKVKPEFKLERIFNKNT